LISGTLINQETSKAISAELSRSGDTYWLKADGHGAAFAVEISEVSDRLGNIPRKITFSDKSVFETDHNDAVDEMLGVEKGFFAGLFKAENSLKAIVFSVVAVAVLVVGIYRYGLPLAAAGAAWATPDVAVEAVNSGTLATVDRALFGESQLEEKRRAEIQLIFDELVKISGNKQDDFDLQFRDGGRLGANAIALPGGTVVMTDQLVALAETEDEIAGVLAHEIGHVVHRHSLKQIYRVMGIAFMASVVGGDSGQVVEELIGQASLLQTMSYSRGFEAEADSFSVKLMIEAGRDPVAFVTLLERIMEDAGIESERSNWLSTHPGNAERREAVEAEVQQLGN